MIPCQRHLFDIPDEIAYFNCAYMSPLLKSVREAGHAGVSRKSEPWKIGPQDFFTESDLVRKLFAQLIHANANDIAIVPSASYGIQVAVDNLPIKAGDEIVLLAEQFPSNVYPWLEKAKLTESRVVMVQRSAQTDWTTAVLQAINENTAVVSLPNLHWTDGSMVELRKISEVCHRQDIPLILDVTQSLGAMPLSVAALRPAFLVCAAYKWLLGPFSLAFLYVASEFQDGRPIEFNWLNRKHSEDFAGLVNYRDDFQAGARRFDVGERCNFALLPMAVAALQQVLSWDVSGISETLGATTARIVEHAEGLGLTAPPAEQRAPHILGIRFPQGLPAGISEDLARENVFVSIRGDAIRISPHLYNNEADLEKLLHVLSKTAG